VQTISTDWVGPLVTAVAHALLARPWTTASPSERDSQGEIGKSIRSGRNPAPTAASTTSGRCGQVLSEHSPARVHQPTQGLERVGDAAKGLVGPAVDDGICLAGVLGCLSLDERRQSPGSVRSARRPAGQRAQPTAARGTSSGCPSRNQKDQSPADNTDCGDDQPQRITAILTEPRLTDNKSVGVGRAD
jgi:hypothetical protein